MKLITKTIAQKLPRLYEGGRTAYVKFFTPWTGWTWYGCEANAFIEYEDGEQEEVGLRETEVDVCDLWNARKKGVFLTGVMGKQTKGLRILDIRFFGFVEGLENEWGYFSLAELEKVRGPFGWRIERDVHFTEQRIGV